MYFTGNAVFRSGKKSYNLIDCDAFKLFPSFKVDLQNDWFR